MESHHKIGFREIEHTADAALKVYGDTFEQLLRNAACGMNSLMVKDIDVLIPRIKKYIDIEAQDTESLLVEWLSELAFWAETELLVFTRFNFLKVTTVRVQAMVAGARAKNIEKHIKAVTYHDLKIIKSARGLETTIVFDV